MLKKIIFSLLVLSHINIHTHGFIAGTLVKTPDGYVPIEQLNIDDQVISYDLEGSWVIAPIVAVHSFEVDQYLLIKTPQDFIGIGFTQRLYQQSKRGWIMANDLTAETGILQGLTNEAFITEFITIEEPTTLYDLSIKQYHNFYVSVDELCVHNWDWPWSRSKSECPTKKIRFSIEEENSLTNNQNHNDGIAVGAGALIGAGTAGVIGTTIGACSVSIGTAGGVIGISITAPISIPLILAGAGGVTAGTLTYQLFKLCYKSSNVALPKIVIEDLPNNPVNAHDSYERYIQCTNSNTDNAASVQSTSNPSIPTIVAKTTNQPTNTSTSTGTTTPKNEAGANKSKEVGTKSQKLSVLSKTVGTSVSIKGGKVKGADAKIAEAMSSLTETPGVTPETKEAPCATTNHNDSTPNSNILKQQATGLYVQLLEKTKTTLSNTATGTKKAAAALQSVTAAKSLGYDNGLKLVCALSGDNDAKKALKDSLWKYRTPDIDAFMNKMLGIKPSDTSSQNEPHRYCVRMQKTTQSSSNIADAKITTVLSTSGSTEPSKKNAAPTPDKNAGVIADPFPEPDTIDNHILITVPAEQLNSITTCFPTNDPLIKELDTTVIGCGNTEPIEPILIIECIADCLQPGQKIDGIKGHKHDGINTPFIASNHPKGQYVRNDKHGKYPQGNIGAAPRFGQGALDNSVIVTDAKGNIVRDSHGLPEQRVAIQDGKYVVLQSTNDGTYHGYIVKLWQQKNGKDGLTTEQREAFIKNNLTKPNGTVIKD